ncbi:MAG: hypothetical protein KGN76_01415 [Acidobacteriota bacterium]|nr:hypothetical protein [Acidobacteriota bacterium]
MKTLIAWQLRKTADALTMDLQRLVFTGEDTYLYDEVEQVVSAFIERVERWLDRAQPSLRQQQRLVGRIYAIRAAEEQALARLRRLALAGPRLLPERRH